MKTRAIDEFVDSINLLVSLTPSCDETPALTQLKAALLQLNTLLREEESSLPVTDNTVKFARQLELEEMMAKENGDYNLKRQKYDLKMARVNAVLDSLKNSVDVAFRTGELQVFKDHALYSELGIKISQTQQEIQDDIADESCFARLFSFCCPSKEVARARGEEEKLKKKQNELRQSSQGTDREKFINDTNSHIHHFELAKLKLLDNPPVNRKNQYRVEWKKIDKDIAAHNRKQLDSVSQNTMLQVVNVYKAYVAYIRQSQKLQNPLVYLMDRITCRDRGYESAWYYYGVGTPQRNKLFQVPVKQTSPVESKRSDVVKSLSR